MSKECLVQRLYPLGREAVSFAVGAQREPYLLDAPFSDGSSLPPNQSRGILFSHFHQDHCPHRTPSVEVETYFNPETLVLLDHIGVDTRRFKDIRRLTPLKPNRIDGLGKVLPIPVSHSSVDALAFFIELENGTTIFFSGDIRNGYRTVKAVETVRKMVGRDGVSLFIGDATGVGKKHITEKEHIERLKEALLLARRNNAGTAIFVKAGDYGNIALWFDKRVFEDCEVFMHPKLQAVLGKGQLNWLPYLYQRYGYVPPVFDQLIPRMHKQGGKIVLLYDDCWKNVIQGEIHVLVNATRREIPCKSDNVLAMFPIGFSGHSQKAFYDLLSVCHPDYVAYSHPSTKKQPDIGQAELVIRKKGKIFPLPDKLRK